MQTYTINLNDTQASYILPLLDDLKIDYAPKDFIEQIEQDAEQYESGKLPTKSIAEYEKEMREFTQDLKAKYANWIKH